MKKPRILRLRYIPYETVDITKDELLYRDKDLLITKWKAIRPRPDISGGVSFTFLTKGYKISKFYDNSNKFIYWYCDILDVVYMEDEDTYILKDLLLDVKLLADGGLQVLDADEMAEALEKGLITVEQVCGGLRKMDEILRMVREGCFPPEVCDKEEFEYKGE